MMITNSKKRRLSKLIIAVLVIILALFVLNYFRLSIKNFFYVISSPIQRSFGRAGDDIAKIFGSDLRKEVINLRIEKQELLNQISVLESLQKENQELRQALDLNLQKDFNLILAGVISKDSAGNIILIDKGSEDGILKDMPVINQQKVLFGRVLEVYKNFSRVNLIIDKSYTFDAKVQGKEIYGVIRGGGNCLYFEYVSKEAELKEGDVLITSALAGEIPKDLLIGEVEKINKEDIKPFQSANVKVFFDLKEADSLFVITNFKN